MSGEARLPKSRPTATYTSFKSCWFRESILPVGSLSFASVVVLSEWFVVGQFRVSIAVWLLWW